jgi:putative restriction endonuclease
MAEAELQAYLDLTPQQIRTYLLDMLARDPPAPGKYQVSFHAVETLLCYGLFSLVDPHRLHG